MPLGVDCPSCKHRFSVPDKMSGRGIKCPRCEHAFTAPNGLAGGSHPDLHLAPVTATAPAPCEGPLPTPAPGAAVPLPMPLPPPLHVQPIPLVHSITSSVPGKPRPPLSPPRR